MKRPPDPTWTRHPIGSARTLTFGAARLEASDTPGWFRLTVAPAPSRLRHGTGIGEECVERGLPAPTLGDLDWVRGEG